MGFKAVIDTKEGFLDVKTICEEKIKNSILKKVFETKVIFCTKHVIGSENQRLQDKEVTTDLEK